MVAQPLLAVHAQAASLYHHAVRQNRLIVLEKPPINEAGKCVTRGLGVGPAVCGRNPLCLWGHALACPDVAAGSPRHRAAYRRPPASPKYPMGCPHKKRFGPGNLIHVLTQNRR